MSAHVLIVEDEPKIATLLRDYLLVADIHASLQVSGSGALERIRATTFDAILLDLNLPGVDGITICRQVREFSQVPILIVTARVEEVDRLIGLELGADDYICKPFSPREVVARVRAVLRRAQSASQTIDHSPLVVDEARFEARIHGTPMTLTPVEFRLLRKLSAQPGRVFSRSQLIESLYEDHRVVSDRTVDSHVKNLRRKLTDRGHDPIESVYGVGYRFEWTGGATTTD